IGRSSRRPLARTSSKRYRGMKGITKPAIRLTKRIAKPTASLPLRASSSSPASLRIVRRGGVFFFFACWPPPRRPPPRGRREVTPPPKRPTRAIFRPSPGVRKDKGGRGASIEMSCADSTGFHLLAFLLPPTAFLIDRYSFQEILFCQCFLP